MDRREKDLNELLGQYGNDGGGLRLLLLRNSNTSCQRVYFSFNNPQMTVRSDRVCVAVYVAVYVKRLGGGTAGGIYSVLQPL